MSDNNFLERIKNVAKNSASVVGILEDEFVFSHSRKKKNFFKSRIIVERFSGTKDFIPVVIEETILKQVGNYECLKGKSVNVTGEFRSYNTTDSNGKMHLFLNLLIDKLEIFNSNLDTDLMLNTDILYLKGTICRSINFRYTPLSKRCIADILLSVERKNGVKDYIPCIVWNKDAKYSAKYLNTGNCIEIIGRIQSRNYEKNGADKIAYEVSIKSIKKID